MGIAGWAVAWLSHIWTPVPHSDDLTTEEKALGASILGYVSAVCYLGYFIETLPFLKRFNTDSSARIPQIVKNYREQSCEGQSAGRNANLSLI